MTNILKISVIGYGNIAQAITKNLSQYSCYTLRVASPSLPIGTNEAGISTNYDNLAIVADADVLILSVKPNIMQEVLEQIRDYISPQSLIISVAAGLSLSWLSQNLSNNQAIIRAMPNIAATVQKGITPLIANSFVSIEQKDQATKLFNCSGLTIWLEQEEELDIYTALSGSGPAYIFLFLEALAEAAERLGLPKVIANKTALQTLIGAGELALLSPSKFRELREQVTSPQGTTAAAINAFEQEGFRQIIFKAVEAAWQRAKELSAPPTKL